MVEAENADKNWYRTNEIIEFVDALEFSAQLSKSVTTNKAIWKWLIIAVHNALQGACVCSLRGNDTAGLAVLTPQSGGELFVWLEIESRKENPNPPPRETLARFPELYRRVCSSEYLPNPLSKNSSRDADIKRLTSLRNDFIHFVPKGLSIELIGLPRIIGSVCEVIRHLAVDHLTFDHHFHGNERQRIIESLEILKTNPGI